jgi:hypothetical protein
VDHLIFSLAKNGGRKVAEASTEKSLHCNQEKKKNSMHAQVFRFREQIHEYEYSPCPKMICSTRRKYLEEN